MRRVDRTPPWKIVYHMAADGSVPAIDFLDGCPGKIDAEFIAVLDGPSREQFRLFCLLENADDDELLKRGLAKPAIAVITGMRKPWRTKFSEADYHRVSRLGEDYKDAYPRRIAV